MTSDEQVLFDDRNLNVTVTNNRLIVGDNVTLIGDLSHAASIKKMGLKEYAIGVLFALIGIAILVGTKFSIMGIFFACILFINPFVKTFNSFFEAGSGKVSIFIFLTTASSHRKYISRL